IMQKHSVIEQGQVETKFGESQKVSGSLNEVESPNFQFTHKGLADRTTAFNQELLQLNPEQLKELQPYFEQHKAIQTLQDLYKQTGDTARLEEINEHNRLIEWKIHNKVEAYLGKHIDYSDMDYYKGIKTGEELQQMMNERLPETESVSGNPEPITETQSQPQVDEPKNFVQNQDNVNQTLSNSAENLTKNQETPQNLIDNSIKGDISSPEIFQEKVMFAKVEETQITQMIDEIAKSRTYLAVDFDNKDAAKAAGAKYDPQAKGWFAEEITPELRQFLPQQPENITAERKALSDFQRQAETIGLDMANFKEVFGSWQRVPIKGKGNRNADGGYKLYRNDDGSIGACAKNYSTGDSVAWNDRLKDGKQIQSKVPLPDYLANQKQKEWNTVAQHTAQSNVAAMRGEVAANAYHQLQPALATDPYIQNKGISDIGKLKRLNDGSTIVPLYHNGKIANLQMIRPNGEKRLMSQAAKVGAYYSIGNTKTPQAVIVAEGVATADSVHQIASEIYGKDKVLVLAAIDSGNLHNVAAKVEQAFPQTEKLIAADNDAHNATRSELKFKNAGLDKANEVQEAYPNFQVALCPALNDEKGQVKNTDWNDFLKAHGKTEAVKAFGENDKYIAQQKATTLPETAVGVSQNSKGSSMGGRE
ncbi:MAG: toprim domain-containing protein, partial [Neisseriaceae bacterium]|nr:toprim domain-containing protein [Neisseriaceae bacterium]